MKDKPLVSVVVPTFNSEGFLERCLSSVRGQTYPNIEVIVVDNYSTDRTRNTAEKYGAKVFRLNSERAEAKNFGLRKAEGKYVCFLDSDMELAPKVIGECVSLVENDGKIGGIIIPERSVGGSFWVRVRDFERSFYVGTEVESARFFRRDLALMVGGFDEDVVFFEESTLPQKIEGLGFNVKRRINAEVSHYEMDFSLRKWLLKKFCYGKSALKYKEKFGGYASKQMSLFYRFSIFLKKQKVLFEAPTRIRSNYLKAFRIFFSWIRNFGEQDEKMKVSIISFGPVEVDLTATLSICVIVLLTALH
jgi:glycosyltransferase involved in cell wall biosynthesis